MMSELRPILVGVSHGLKDSIFGIISIYKLEGELEKREIEKRRIQEDRRHQRYREPMRQYRFATWIIIWHNISYGGTILCMAQNEDAKQRNQQGASPIYRKMLQCILLNGGIFWMSIFLFENYFLPALQLATLAVFRLVTGNSSQHDSVWSWISPSLSYMFSALWVLPLFWLSKPLNSLWYQEIADTAYRKTKGRPLGLLFLEKGESVATYVSKIIADISFSLLLQVFFLFQAMATSFLPIVGPVVSLVHMCLLYSLYTFEYKWINMGWIVQKRLSYIECNWPYFVGFGLPLAVLTSLPSSIVVSGCVFAILFPLFIVSGNAAQPMETIEFPLRVFSLVIWLTNKVFSRSSVKSMQPQTSPQLTQDTPLS